MALVDLVYPASITGSSNYSSEPPLGPIALYSSLPQAFRKEVRFLDSTIISQEEIESSILKGKADIVAISCTTYNYLNALKVAELAKKNGSYVICGGIHITHRRDMILAKMLKGERPFDYIITGYGEPSFSPLISALLENNSVAEIPNLCYIKNGKITINKSDNRKFGSDPLTFPLDYSKIDFEKYSSNFKPYGNLISSKIIGSTYTQRGCAYSGPKQCVFCSIERKCLRRSSHLFEKDLLNLISQYNVDQVRITDGDFTMDIKHMQQVRDAAVRVFRETGRKPLFHCFARADEIDEKRAEILRDLNVVSLMVGYESGSNRMLKSMNKHTTKEVNLSSTHFLKKYGIEVICGGLVLGAEGEDEISIGETIDFAQKLKEIGNTTTMVATPLIPLPGSTCFNTLLKKTELDYPSKYKELLEEDNFNIEELIELWNHYSCNISISRLIDVCNEIEEMFPIGIRLVDLKKIQANIKKDVITY